MITKSKQSISSDVWAPQVHPIYADYVKVVRYWMLHILVPLGIHKDLILDNLCRDAEVLRTLGLNKLVDTPKFIGHEARNAVFRLYEAVSKKPMPAVRKTGLLAKNIAWLAKTMGLDEVDQKILLFRIIASRHLALRTCLDNLGNGLDHLYVINVIARLIGIDEFKVELALSHNGRLVQTGLITINPQLNTLMMKVGLLPGMADSLLGTHHDPYQLFWDNFRLAPEPKLSKSNYPHLADDIEMLCNYVSESIAQNRHGVNVLIYGSPGSGKTEFVRMLAQQLGVPLFEVATETASGEPIRQAHRFRSFRLSQHILASGKKLPIILFDEVEDVFHSGGVDDENRKQEGAIGIKGWVNKLLEHNRIPAFWLSNSIESLDKAFIRRFDYVIEMNTPPRSVRKQILNQYLDSIGVSQRWKASVAEHEYLNPAVIERAAKVVETTRMRHSDLSIEQSLERMLGNTLGAMGLSWPSSSLGNSQTKFRLDILNSDHNLNEICGGLRSYKEGRLCLYGPPGTGKSAFGRFLAEHLDLPLIIKRASDILSPFVGGTEKNLAKMFREAKQEGAILILDEADTFLQDRKSATRSWEVSEVNEMLTQMETYEGIFVASTNLIGDLDSAALRRFDIKVKFDFLMPHQSWELFQDISRSMGISATDSSQSQLQRLSNLTPGDFANVLRQSRLCKISSEAELLNKLTAESRFKPEGIKRGIGFASSPGNN